MTFKTIPGLVSVIIPHAPIVGGGEESFHPGCLPSLREQTLKSIEVIPVPGLSCQEARNEGFRRAAGEFVVFSDADIIWHPEAMSMMRDTLERNPEKAYAYTGYSMRGSRYGTYRSRSWTADALKHENFVSTMAMTRRSTLARIPDPGPFDPEIKRLQDWDLWLTLLAMGYEGIWVESLLFTAYFSADGISMRGDDDLTSAIAIVRGKHIVLIRNAKPTAKNPLANGEKWLVSEI